ncbi:hypothetical protein [Pseudomonas sp. CC6-YY-74]|uniref:hypothetical protein n=1 Tax=Pseudomonas sp. CC6-YY-74 TaxID=1930532 RepID=UPI001C488261|nr:hypothetical protein [Pseudomonas sp. CC6-YY-74]
MPSTRLAVPKRDARLKPGFVVVEQRGPDRLTHRRNSELVELLAMLMRGFAEPLSWHIESAIEFARQVLECNKPSQLNDTVLVKETA